MLTWIIACIAALFLALLGSAGYVALFVRDAVHRADAYKVLKLVMTVAIGAGGTSGLLSLVRNLHELGVL
ncbi:hypothetical protein ACGFMK_40455 [Amycolatopsis sp. NPDC049252]|uniref:hypothetical protein n=1 Tax=Amycolatopsis sp. NPDC049252 TaxID=3363933 RepID=UPI003719AB02